MRKIRLYLDTSIISMIDAPHAPDKEAITKEFFRIVNKKPDEYELFISPMGILEIENSPSEKLLVLTNFLQDLRYTELPESQEAEDLTKLYIKGGAFPICGALIWIENSVISNPNGA